MKFFLIFRAMVLAADHFLNDYPNDIEVSKFTNSSRLFAFFRDFDKHLSYVVNLISLVNVNQLTQENVSCLNTSLVILMLNRKRGKLDNMLEAISERKDSFGMSVDVLSDRGPGKKMLENLKTLLIFW